MHRLSSGRFWLLIVPLAAALAAVAVIVLTSGDDEADPENGASGELGPSPVSSPGGDGTPKEEGSRPSTGADEERRAIRAVRAYVDAIDDRDGARVCFALAPDALEDFRMPRESGGCAESLERSIGYRDPRGYPVFANARVDAVGDVAIAGDDTRVTATIVTEFADRDQPSIEDDLIYLVEVDGEFRVARPSAVLYRAVGRPEVPLKAVAPPG